MTKFEAHKDLTFALSPFQDWRRLDVRPIFHLDLLQHAAIDLDAFIDHSRNSMTVESTRVVELVEALQRQSDQLQLATD